VWRAGLLLAVVLALLLPTGGTPLAADDLLDFDIPNGHFFKQANGMGGAGSAGYSVLDDAEARFWSEFKRLGGVPTVGYPVSRRFLWDGFICQAFQKVIFQWRPEIGQVYFVNVFDRLSQAGLDAWLDSVRQTPPSFDNSPDSGLTWDRVVQRHLGLLDSNSTIKASYMADSNPILHYGLPMSYKDYGNVFVVRAQRAVFQQWKEDVPWAKAGEVVVANGGDVAKEAGVLPAQAVTPEASPSQGGQAPARDHDWRRLGFISAVDGQLYDPGCVPLRSAGTNVPNLAYRSGLEGHLEWMRQHRLRWLRVFATGHAPKPGRAPRDSGAAVRALRSLLSSVEAFNARHASSESIYVLVSLTDYYPPGVPGEGHVFDHPTFQESPVLPAPWYRAGVPWFSFEQEHGRGWVYGLPNYEVNYKPWVHDIVSSLADSRTLMGWQLGNELKARGSTRNGISSPQAYDWYLAFTKDMVDTIRSLDRNHLIFTGAQYLAELTDWEYRPQDALAADRVPEYERLALRMLNACGEYCWNVWSLTAYDFNLYPLDDLAWFSQAGVPVVATEYGFTLNGAEEMRRRFGGDRAVAVRSGLDRAWVALDGSTQARLPSAAELMTSWRMAAIAPWGSPAPEGEWELDADGNRGITGTADAGALWAAWGEVGSSLESANREAGSSAACLGFQSP